MLLLILTAILSVIEGINIYKGTLFSFYLIDFGKRVQGLVFILVASLLPVLFIFFSFYVVVQSELLVLGVILALSYLPKIILWKYYHYSGNYIPSLTNAMKWYVMNYIIKMDFILPMYISLIGLNYLLVFILAGLITRMTVIIIIRNFKSLFLKIIRLNLPQVENLSSDFVILALLIALHYSI
jgi:hypothetical protein